MPHNKNHIYAILKENGKVVSIENVENGIKCGCICSKCGEPLIAKNNPKKDRIKHFAHSSGSLCSGETQAHLVAKEIISKNKYIVVPFDKQWRKLKFDEVKVEQLIGDSDYRADLLCKKNNREVVIEIEVKGPLSDEKALYLKDQKIPTIIVDLKESISPDQFNNIPENFHEIVLEHQNNKKWFFNERLNDLEKLKAEKENELKEIKRKEREKIQKRKDEKHKIWLANHLKRQKLFHNAIRAIQSKNKDNLIYGRLVRENLYEFGERKYRLTFCVKSQQLSSDYRYLAKVYNYFDERFFDGTNQGHLNFWKSKMGNKIGIKIIDDIDKSFLNVHHHPFDPEYEEWNKDKVFPYFPHCMVYWIDSDKTKKDVLNNAEKNDDFHKRIEKKALEEWENDPFFD